MRGLVVSIAITGCWSGAARDPSPAPTVTAAGALPRGPFATRPLAGPYRDRAAWCADLKARLQQGDDPPAGGVGCVDGGPRITRGPVALGASGGAITRAELVAYQREPDDLWGPQCALLLHGAAGVWAHEAVGPCLAPAGATSLVTEVVIEELAWRDVVDRAPQGEALGRELVLRVRTRRHVAQPDIEAKEQSLIVCGAGASGTPRCTPPLPIARDQDPFRVDYHPAIGRDGTLRFALEDHGEMMAEEDRAAFALEHAVRFP